MVDTLLVFSARDTILVWPKVSVLFKSITLRLSTLQAMYSVVINQTQNIARSIFTNLDDITTLFFSTFTSLFKPVLYKHHNDYLEYLSQGQTFSLDKNFTKPKNYLALQKY